MSPWFSSLGNKMLLPKLHDSHDDVSVENTGDNKCVSVCAAIASNVEKQLHKEFTPCAKR